MDKIEQKLHEISGGDVLDIATGGGPNISEVEPLLRDYRCIIGVDRKMSGLIEATTEKFPNHPNIHFACMDAYRLALPDNSFDTVMISNSLHHLDNPVAVLGEMVRVTRPGGHLIVFEMIRDNLTEQQTTHALMHHWWAAVDRRAGIVHNETLTRDQILAVCTEAGLRECDTYTTSDSPAEPLGPEEIPQLERLIDTYPDKIPDHPDRDRLIEKGREIKRRLHEIGIAWATGVAVFGVKYSA